ncbi:MAG: DUF885 family protein, partial [Acidobacteria bacterium]|nr:DUF885 family protein [Acidobacteriota bacterium]
MIALAAALSAIAIAGRAPSGSAAALGSFHSLVDQYFDFYFSSHPSQGTSAGLHQYDRMLEDYSAAARQREIRGFKDFLGQFESLDGSRLPGGQAADREWLISSIHSGLLELEDIQMWRKDPGHYSGNLTNSIFVIMKRDYAPLNARLRSVIERENKIPRALELGRQSLENPPRIYVDIALEQLPDETDFFRNDVPRAFSGVADEGLLREFKAANQKVITAFEDYRKYLEDSVLPRANGDFRLGAENYRRKLLYDEMVDIPLDRLLEIGYQDLHRNQEALKKAAATIDSRRPL